MGGGSPVFPEVLGCWDGSCRPVPVFPVFPEELEGWEGRSQPGIPSLTCFLHLLHRFGDLGFKCFGLVRRHRGRHGHHCGDKGAQGHLGGTGILGGPSWAGIPPPAMDPAQSRGWERLQWEVRLPRLGFCTLG